MNPMYVKLTLSLFRQVLKVVGVTGLAISDQEWVQVLSALATIWGFAWGFWKDYKEQQKLVTALGLHHSSTMDDVESRIKRGDAASVLTLRDEVPVA